MANQEIMGLRDWRLSQRHREWGGNCPMIDLDMIVAEFDTCRPAALIEYKHCSRSGHSMVQESAGVKTFRALAEMAGLPAWVAFYRPWSWSFKVACQNAAARAVWGTAEEYIVVTERQYVEVLYRLRGRTLPDAVAMTLNSTHDTLPGLAADFDVLRRQAQVLPA